MKKYFILLVLITIFSACTQQTINYTEETDDTCPPPEKYTLSYGESIYIGDHTVTIQDITISSADVDVDGSSSYISTGSTLKINDVEIYVIATNEENTVTLELSC